MKRKIHVTLLATGGHLEHQFTVSYEILGDRRKDDIEVLTDSVKRTACQQLQDAIQKLIDTELNNLYY